MLPGTERAQRGGLTNLKFSIYGVPSYLNDHQWQHVVTSSVTLQDPSQMSVEDYLLPFANAGDTETR